MSIKGFILLVFYITLLACLKFKSVRRYVFNILKVFFLWVTNPTFKLPNYKYANKFKFKFERKAREKKLSNTPTVQRNKPSQVNNLLLVFIVLIGIVMIYWDEITTFLAIVYG